MPPPPSCGWRGGVDSITGSRPGRRRTDGAQVGPRRSGAGHPARMRDVSTLDNLRALAAERGGIIPTFRLRSAGFGPSVISALRRRGILVRVRQGWYALPGLADDAMRAARVGGQATCHTALRHHGVWVLPDARLHVALPAHAVRPRDPDDHRRRRDPSSREVAVHWRGAYSVVDRPIASVVEALGDLERCGPFESFAVGLDSALHLGLVTAEHELAKRHAAAGITGVCESGIETLFWLRLPALRRSIRRQVDIPGVGRVDFLIGLRLVVEVDGREHHASPESFERDRARDAHLARLGYRVVRFSYRQIMHEWGTVEATVRGLVAQGEHRARRGSPLARAE